MLNLDTSNVMWLLFSQITVILDCIWVPFSVSVWVFACARIE